MRTSTFVYLTCLFLTGCANGWTPVSKQVSNGEYYWLTPLPSGTGIVTAPNSAGVTTYTGTVNGKGYSVTSFR